jgi:hypothetical protein
VLPRRRVRDYEGPAAVSEAMIYGAVSRGLLRRLTQLAA